MSRPVGEQWPVGFDWGEIYTDPRLPAFLIGQKHLGRDYLTPLGVPVLSPVNGVLNYWGFLHGYGNTVIIKFWAGIWPFVQTWRVLLCHLHSFVGLKTIGQRIKKYQEVALSGNTGWSTGPHLHGQIEKLVNGVWIPVDPTFVFGKN